MKSFLRVGLFVLCSSLAAQAAVITLTFEGLGNNEAIGNFYNGGTGGSGSGPGTNYGITFNVNALALIDSDVTGGTGNFGGEPSPDTILFFTSGSAAIMNVAAGFDTGLSFFYTAIFQTGSVTIWDGLGGTGNILGTFNLPLTPNNGAPDPTGIFSPLLPIGVAFTGTARSVSFAGVAGQIGFDNVTFGSEVPTETVPEPSTYLLVATGIAGVVMLRRRK